MGETTQRGIVHKRDWSACSKNQSFTQSFNQQPSLKYEKGYGEKKWLSEKN